MKMVMIFWLSFLLSSSHKLSAVVALQWRSLSSKSIGVLRCRVLLMVVSLSISSSLFWLVILDGVVGLVSVWSLWRRDVSVFSDRIAASNFPANISFGRSSALSMALFSSSFQRTLCDSFANQCFSYIWAIFRSQILWIPWVVATHSFVISQ